MNKTEKLTLIEGDFSFDEAKEILTSMFSSKINFHNIQNWSSQERFGKDDEIAQKRIPALRNEMKKLEEILSEAKAQNKKLVVSSEINISLLED
ncbi:hypothetical protein FNW25_03950 [Flavobacterium franklandianum]|uniref:Uncharacterized protein n=1 Tax=Flavobacterium franklandianum TaxID=2594430 RepID=A0A553CP23_9FLAO|nr:hypothetical protein [Flavobacterium franklandianum]TRX22239.1 hypothetical protein FNW17_06095 [Flavobacterium franklandianum]TRX28915.1 hypothetical protein FNW25_03950 [Flavobacterium franklandianum]